MTTHHKAALVTGGAKRIGQAIVRALTAKGYAVAIHCHASQQAAEHLAQDCRAQGHHVAVVMGDLGQAEALPHLLEASIKAVGPLSLLVNNASAFERDQADAIDPDLWDRQFAINLKAPCLLAEQFMARLDHSIDDPSIINLIDQRVLRPNPHYFSYTLTKSALWTATRTMAQSFAPRARVNGVGPGPTLANQHEGEAGFLQERAGLLLHGGPEPADIAEAVVYLAGAKQVTGQIIAVDGGQHLGWKTLDVVL